MRRQQQMGDRAVNGKGKGVAAAQVQGPESAFPLHWNSRNRCRYVLEQALAGRQSAGGEGGWPATKT